MVKKKESIHLNGTSKQFLVEFFILKEKLLNHLDDAEKKNSNLDAKLDKLDKKLDTFIQTLTIHKTYFKIIGAILGAAVLAFFSWAVTVLA